MLTEVKEVDGVFHVSVWRRDRTLVAFVMLPRGADVDSVLRVVGNALRGASVRGPEVTAKGAS